MPRELPIYQIDAFADAAFTGNPAAVVPLEDWLGDDVMQAIAAENNLSETAFFVAAPRRGAGAYDLRWFTPAAEVDLCGHATLASAFLLFTELTPAIRTVRFHTRSGELIVHRADDGFLAMDLPAYPAVKDPRAPEIAGRLKETLGRAPLEVRRANYLMGIYGSGDDVRALSPGAGLQSALHDADVWGLIVTAPGEGEYDFISRFFAPAKGVPEDPVTGSAHAMLAPYWAGRLGKPKVTGYQASARGGVVRCLYDADKAPDCVTLHGRCILYLRGRIIV